MLGGNPDVGDEDIRGILEDQGQSLTTTILGSSDFDDDERILAAAHEEASSMSGGSGFDYL